MKERNGQKKKTRHRLKATKQSKRGYKKRMHKLWNDIGMFEIEEQHLACQVRSNFKNNRLTEIEIQQLQREIEKDKIVPDRADKVPEMSYGGSNVT